MSPRNILPTTAQSRKKNPLSFFGCGLLLMAVTVTLTLHAQNKNPFAGDPKAARLGEFQFRSNCAFCHGLGARGGGRGPDLTRAKKHHGNSDADMFRNIREGVAGTAMPAAVGSIGVGMTEEEIWQVVTYLRSVQVKAPAQPIGNAARGKGLYEGSAACATCHMIQGEGGRLGPDLTDAGAARSVDSLMDSVRNPSRRLAPRPLESAQESETVIVVTADGQKFIGVVLNDDNFSVQMMDTRERIHLFEKDKLKSFEKTRESLMPAYDQKALSDKDLQDIVAYLLGIAGNGGGNHE